LPVTSTCFSPLPLPVTKPIQSCPSSTGIQVRRSPFSFSAQPCPFSPASVTYPVSLHASVPLLCFRTPSSLTWTAPKSSSPPLVLLVIQDPPDGRIIS
jgi:hypothetical protein